MDYKVSLSALDFAHKLVILFAIIYDFYIFFDYILDALCILMKNHVFIPSEDRYYCYVIDHDSLV